MSSHDSSTIDKFWFHPGRNETVNVDGEHDDEIGFSRIDHPLQNGWVRGGLSEVTGCYHLEAANLEILVLATRMLLESYGPAEGLHYDLTAADGKAIGGAILTKRQMDNLIVTGKPKVMHRPSA